MSLSTGFLRRDQAFAGGVYNSSRALILNTDTGGFVHLYEKTDNTLWAEIFLSNGQPY
jgi:hypothetical protein